MKSEAEVSEELERLFPGESNEARLDEWRDLVKEGLLVAADNKIRKWQLFVSQRRSIAHQEADLHNQLTTNYIELTESPLSSGIKIQGFSEIGHLKINDASISLEAREFVDVDLRQSTYIVRIALWKNGEAHYSNVSYDEIPKLIVAIEALKKVGSGVTKFQNFQADWVGEGGFSISIFNTKDGKIKGVLQSDGSTVFLNSITKFDELAKLIIDAKSYINNHLQPVGEVDFVLIEKAKKEQEEFLSRFPEFIIELSSPYIPILTRKFMQLCFIDEYGMREYGSFYSELDKFIYKFIPGLSDDHRRVARDIITSVVEKQAKEQEGTFDGFDPNMTPLDYERYCANAFSQAGWSTTMTPKTGDQGADVVLKYHDLTGVVQCKLYSQPVGNSGVQEAIAAREYYKASIAIVVSNAPYTAAARQLAAAANVVLLHHDEIAAHSHRFGVGIEDAAT